MNRKNRSYQIQIKFTENFPSEDQILKVAGKRPDGGYMGSSYCNYIWNYTNRPKAIELFTKLTESKLKYDCVELLKLVW